MYPLKEYLDYISPRAKSSFFLINFLNYLQKKYKIILLKYKKLSSINKK